MDRSESMISLVFSAHTLARIGAYETGNDAPSGQWRALSVLAQQGELRIGELSRLARMTQPGTTRMVNLLHDRGFVERCDDPQDSRVTVVRLNPAGRSALAHWREQLGAALAPRFSELSDADWDALVRAAELLSVVASGQEGATR